MYLTDCNHRLCQIFMIKERLLNEKAHCHPIGSSSDCRVYPVLVLDVSDTAEFLKSGRTIYTANSAISYVKQSAKQFLTDLLNARGENYVAVVSFAEQAQLVSGFTNDISSVSQKVSSLTAHDTVRDINAGLTKANALLQDADTDAVIRHAKNIGEFFHLF